VQAQAFLFQHFETVGHVNAAALERFDLQEKIPENALNSGTPMPLAWRLPYALLVAGLRGLGSNTLAVIAEAYPAFYLGAKNFQPPRGLGVSTSLNCYVAVSREGVGRKLDSVFKGAKVRVFGKAIVWEWSLPPYEGHPESTTFYAAHIINHYLVVCNRPELVESAVLRVPISKPEVDLPDWFTFRNYEYWLHRRSPDIPHARSIILVADFAARGGRIIVALEPGHLRIRNFTLPMSNQIRFEEISSAVWEAKVPVGDDVAALGALLTTFAYFGYGVAL
jgi:hypothetical protein